MGSNGWFLAIDTFSNRYFVKELRNGWFKVVEESTLTDSIWPLGDCRNSLRIVGKCTPQEVKRLESLKDKCFSTSKIC